MGLLPLKTHQILNFTWNKIHSFSWSKKFGLIWPKSVSSTLYFLLLHLLHYALTTLNFRISGTSCLSHLKEFPPATCSARGSLPSHHISFGSHQGDHLWEPNLNGVPLSDFLSQSLAYLIHLYFILLFYSLSPLIHLKKYISVHLYLYLYKCTCNIHIFKCIYTFYVYIYWSKLAIRLCH